MAGTITIDELPYNPAISTGHFERNHDNHDDYDDYDDYDDR